MKQQNHKDVHPKKQAGDSEEHASAHTLYRPNSSEKFGLYSLFFRIVGLSFAVNVYSKPKHGENKTAPPPALRKNTSGRPHELQSSGVGAGWGGPPCHFWQHFVCRARGGHIVPRGFRRDFTKKIHKHKHRSRRIETN